MALNLGDLDGPQEGPFMTCLLPVASITSLPMTDHLSACKSSGDLRLDSEQIYLTRLFRVALPTLTQTKARLKGIVLLSLKHD